MAERTARPHPERAGHTAGDADSLVGGTQMIVVSLRDDHLHEPLADLRWRLDTLLATGASMLVIDVGRLTRLSSATVAVLLWVSRRCRARGVRVVLHQPSRSSVEFLHRTGLLSRVETVPRIMGTATTGSHPR